MAQSKGNAPGSCSIPPTQHRAVLRYAHFISFVWMTLVSVGVSWDLRLVFSWENHFLYWIVRESETTLITPHRPHKTRGMLPKEKDWALQLQEEWRRNQSLWRNFVWIRSEHFVLAAWVGLSQWDTMLKYFDYFFGKGGKFQSPTAP